jgi:hypothetical protein
VHHCPLRESVTSSTHEKRVYSLHHGMLAGVVPANGGTLESFSIHDPRPRPMRTDGAMTETPVDVLQRWVECGGTWRVRAMLEPGALVTLCTCYGEPVDELRSDDPAFARYVEERADLRRL